MIAQFVECRVVTRAKRQESVLKITHQQTASFEMPRDAFTEGLHEQFQRRSRGRDSPAEARAFFSGEGAPFDTPFCFGSAFTASI